MYLYSVLYSAEKRRGTVIGNNPCKTDLCGVRCVDAEWKTVFNGAAYSVEGASNCPVTVSWHPFVDLWDVQFWTIGGDIVEAVIPSDAQFHRNGRCHQLTSGPITQEICQRRVVTVAWADKKKTLYPRLTDDCGDWHFGSAMYPGYGTSFSGSCPGGGCLFRPQIATNSTVNSTKERVLMPPRSPTSPPLVSSGPPRYRCVECSHPVSSLYTIYSKDNVRLTQCVPTLFDWASWQRFRTNAKSLLTSILNMTLSFSSSISYLSNHKYTVIFSIIDSALQMTD